MIIDNLFIGVGSMKAGTTWITKNLSTHPDIFFSYEKELSYFSYIHDDKSRFFLSDKNRMLKIQYFINIASKSNIVNMKNVAFWAYNYLNNPINDYWYLNNFSLRGNEKYCADFSNLYSHLDDKGWNHIHSISKNLKIVYIMRDPIKRLWSHVRFQLGIDGKLEEAKEWTKEQMYEYSNVEHMLRNSEYTKIVKTLKKNLKNNELHIIFFEDIKNNPIVLLNGIEKFLQIEERHYDIEKLKEKVNPSQTFSMPDYFMQLFEQDLKYMVQGLDTLGIKVPENWSIK